MDVHLRNEPDTGLIVAVDTDHDDEMDYVVRCLDAERHLRDRVVYRPAIIDDFG